VPEWEAKQGSWHWLFWKMFLVTCVRGHVASWTVAAFQDLLLEADYKFPIKKPPKGNIIITDSIRNSLPE
jgi:hypothetical protein